MDTYKHHINVKMERRLTDKELIEELEHRFLQNKKSFDEQNRLMEQLQLLNKKLEQSETMKSNFLSNIRNEINNPFTSILGLSRAISQFQGSSSDKVKSMASLIYLEAFNLDFQLKNIFAAAELEAGESSPQIIQADINNLVKNVCDSFREVALRKNIVIEHSETEPSIFNTDTLKFQLILSNLISNAIEFSPFGSKVEVYSCVNDDILHLNVRDYGIGISEKDVSKIFDRFMQLDSGMTKNHKGHGLGLSVSKALAESLSGDIKVERSEKGSTFVFYLPNQENSNSPCFSEHGNDTFFTQEEKF